MSYWSSEEKEMLYYAKKRFKEGKCFFCGKPSVGALYLIPKNGKRIPAWKRIFRFYEEHRDRQYGSKRINNENAERYARIVGTYYDFRWF